MTVIVLSFLKELSISDFKKIVGRDPKINWVDEGVIAGVSCVFVEMQEVEEKHIDEFIDLMEEARQQDDERGYLDKLKSKAKIIAYGTIIHTY